MTSYGILLSTFIVVIGLWLEGCSSASTDIEPTTTTTEPITTTTEPTTTTTKAPEEKLKYSQIVGSYVFSHGVVQLTANNVYINQYTTTTEDTGVSSSTYTVESIADTKQNLVASNAATNVVNGGKFSVFDWIESRGVIYMCQSGDDYTSANAAQNSALPSSNNPTRNGCGKGNKAWIALTPSEVAITGSYKTNYGGQISVTAMTWASGGSEYHFLEVSNTNKRVISWNDPKNGYFPGKFSRFDWTEFDGSLWYCEIAYRANTIDEAAAMTSDPTDPSKGGCSQFKWTQLIPK